MVVLSVVVVVEVILVVVDVGYAGQDRSSDVGYMADGERSP